MLTAVIATLVSCKKFLNIVPVDNLSGNNFWQTKADVEGFTNGLYSTFRAKVGQGSCFAEVPDMRCAPLVNVSAGSFLPLLTANNLKALQANSAWTSTFVLQTNTRWKEFFDVVAAANILYAKIDEVPAGALSESERRQYKAEAVFMRNISYFMMVRLFGDVPYYTKPFSEDKLPRTPMVTVLKNCIADMQEVKNDLPWTYSDPSKVGVRAMRGSAIALLMHMNMWAAGFDPADANKAGYYDAVINLGKELETSTDYRLLPYDNDQYKLIFKGRTKESLFEVFQNSNNGEKLSALSNLGYLLSHYPLKGTVNTTASLAYYEKEWMDKVYSDGTPDGRKDAWFENRTSNSGNYQFKKFANVYADGLNILNDDDIIIFRLSDAYLLAAEANADRDADAEAKRYLNLVRARAGAAAINSTGDVLKDDIYYERVRELMGEGHYYYDLVRTKRVTDSKYCKYPISVTDFNAGAWTWPIDASALTNNPNMTLNNFWR
ncbi:RagB/SusD family nutrient uptake outer membrane protein [Mucilaginibacter mali]|uniref:RagB/SusD family nutrient uptake outer membrane protein n=1 Tax=Mucilaginibacter mali TaxID=2740462 RepID=A0A7D4PVJ4_9SPHI|nr:RagB/SusD family nutrient uptake outer membrane protein [Mucilaginibacter mali]QKJ31083.1 RagB/SusD family nutrient uptake outer membrane protein [Mucilaginibacter mali]